jgi:energy-coupling factor transport system permease protein
MRVLAYRDRETAIHRLNPLVKLGWGGGLLVLSLLFDHPVYLLAGLLAVVWTVKVAGTGRAWAAVMQWCLWLGISIIVINALVSYHGTHVLLTAPFKLPVLGRPVITVEAIAYGAVMALKLAVIISAFAFINFTVHPDDFLAVLLKVKLPYKSVLTTSLSARFMPCLLEDVNRISDAYRTRGVELDEGRVFSKLKNWAGIIMPLLANSLERAVQVAEAMESRAFGLGVKRTYYKEIRVSRLDAVALVSTMLPLATGITARIYGFGDYQFYPTLEAISPGFGGIFLPSLLWLLLLLIWPLALIQRRVELD